MTPCDGVFAFDNEARMRMQPLAATLIGQKGSSNVWAKTRCVARLTAMAEHVETVQGSKGHPTLNLYSAAGQSIMLQAVGSLSLCHVK